ncbi:MAG: hypothetical protein IJS54_02775 [Desulfovibrio sp.]|nr:hypothetical protein [Desulfovibrio sp.]
MGDGRQASLFDLLNVSTESQEEKDRKALDDLFYEVGMFKSTKDYKKLFEFVKKFSNIAAYNAFLLYIQRPGCEFVETAKNWAKKFERTVKPGASPLVILRNFGPVDFVFDVSDTEGKSIPDEIINPFKVTKGEIDPDKQYRLVDNLKSYGIKLEGKEFGSQLAGQAMALTNKTRETFSYTYNKREIQYTVRYSFKILVNSKLSQKERFATIIHELGHIFCGHLGTIDEKIWKSRGSLSKNSMEFEAESITWLLCERFGIDNPSAEYLKGYLNKNNEIPSISIDTVLKSVGKIEGMMSRRIKPVKNVLVEDESQSQRMSKKGSPRTR